MGSTSTLTRGRLIDMLRAARGRQLQVFCDLSEIQGEGRQAHHLEPPRWEMGHVAWFQELTLLRQLGGKAPIEPRFDGIFDSFNVSYKDRWKHDLPGRDETLIYAETVLRRSIAQLENDFVPREHAALYSLVADHEAMHTENTIVVRRSLGYSPVHETVEPLEVEPLEVEPLDIEPAFTPKDISVAGGPFLLGASKDDGFVLDNEQWRHEVLVEPFRIANLPVTCGQFAEFLDAGAYATRSLWTKDGWNWRRREKIEGPLYWRRTDGSWHERHFGGWRPIAPWHPMCHVNLHEARAYCRFVGRRLPSEAEWEMAASWNPETGKKSRYPWGDAPPTAERAHLNANSGTTVDVRAKAAGDSALGCRQMIGNVWEWTASKLDPYPGFAPGAYRQYSLPYLGRKPVLRGGGSATSASLIRNTWRNFYIKHRRNIFAGLRTCAK